MEVKRTERGWAGHYICADRCKFRRNTLLQLDDLFVVVSTVGSMASVDGTAVEEIGYQRYYETMVFLSDPNDGEYHDADWRKQISVNGEWSIEKLNKDNEANDMHDAVVEEISSRMMNGTLIEEQEDD